MKATKVVVVSITWRPLVQFQPPQMIKNKEVLSKREGLMLYWCEGDRPAGKNYMVAVTSSDYLIIKNFISWLIRYFNVPRSTIKLRLHLWPDSDEKRAKNYWAEALELPMSNFTKSYIKPKSGENKKYKYGICRAGIYSKELLSEIMASIKKEFC